jgi:hypothetical protein
MQSEAVPKRMIQLIVKTSCTDRVFWSQMNDIVARRRAIQELGSADPSLLRALGFFAFLEQFQAKRSSRRD